MISKRALGASIAVVALLAATASIAQVRQFQVPSDEAARSIPEFARQAGVQITAPVSELGGVRTRAIVGSQDVRAALAELLVGTGLEVASDDGRTIVLRRATIPNEDVAVLEEVLVTGSNIRGVAPVGSALIGVSRDTIALQAPANTRELLSLVPQLGNFGINHEQATPNRFRTAGFLPNVHNLGVYATLTLVNGHRIAPTGGEAVLPDPSIVPVIAIERVELVADGASSIYGSDAVAGVLNFIYRQRFEGLEAQATYGFNDTRYEKQNFAVMGGRRWDGGGISAAYEYSSTKSPLNGEIPFIAAGGDQRERGGRDLRGTVCTTPTVRAVNAQGAATGATYGNGPNWTTNAVDLRCGLLNPDGRVIPDGERNAFLLLADHQVTDSLRLWAEVNYSHYDAVTENALGSFSIVVPRTNPYFQAPPQLATADRLLVTRSATGLFDRVLIDQYAQFAGLTVGADIDLGNDWVGNLMVHASATRDWSSSGELDQPNAVAAANGTTFATALNLFGQAADNNPAVLALIDNGAAQANKSSQRLREITFKADGPLFSLPGGDVLAAVGVNYRGDQSIQLQTSGSSAPGASYNFVVRDDNVNRSVAALFSEVNVPLVSDANAIPGVARLTLSVSGRYDYYEEYGGQFNPKYGLIYSPIDGLDLRASYGTNFAAPNAGLITTPFTIPQLNQNLTQQIAVGPLAGRAVGLVNVLNIGGGNPDLKPEEAETYSFGFTATPRWGFLDGLRFGASYYSVDYTNLVYKPTTTDVISNPAFEDYRIFFPTDAQIAETLRLYAPQRPITTGFGMIFNSNAINIGQRRVAGLDIDVAYRLPTDTWGTFDFSVNANQQLVYELQASPGRPWVDQLRTPAAPEWKSTTRLTWTLDPVTLSLAAHYIGGVGASAQTADKPVDANTVLDLTAAYRLPPIGMVRNAQIQIRAANLLDEDPPFVDNGNAYLPVLGSPFGRTIDVTLRAPF